MSKTLFIDVRELPNDKKMEVLSALEAIGVRWRDGSPATEIEDVSEGIESVNYFHIIGEALFYDTSLEPYLLHEDEVLVEFMLPRDFYEK